ncbi:MAG: S8 family serine peptidase [Desulfobacterium sp.]|nr:S8 family serine peptidase [Desulfobacterium sp.]
MVVKKISFLGFMQIVPLFLFMLCVGCGGGGGGDSPPETGLAPAFSISPGTGNAPVSVSLDASASTATGQTINAYTWDFGDGSTGSGQAVSHLYTKAGNYTVVLTVTGSSSGSSSLSKPVVVTAPPTSATVSGKIIISPGNLADTDTNDSNSIFKENNSFGSAQQISSPITLGGYVNQAQMGARGRSFLQGDLSDIYSVYFAGNETISLSFADSFSNDLDLYLYNDAFELVNSSKDVAGIETLKVGGAGNYYIRVYAYGGASTYILTLGQNTTAALDSGMTLGDDFVPGEVIVGYTPPEKAAGSLAAKDLQQGVEPVLVKLNAGSRYSISSLLPMVEKRNSETAALIPNASDILLAKDRTLNMLKALKARDDVAYAEPNFIRKAFATTPSDPHYVSQWHYPLINLPQAWDTSVGNSNVIVAVIDTGVLLAHPDLVNRLTPGYDFISDSGNALDGDGIDNNPNDPGDKRNGSASSFHGSHVAGTVGAASNNALGVSGVAWNAMIMPLRVLGGDGGSTYDSIQALKYAAGLTNDSGTLPQQRADIINMSYGSTSYSQAEQNTIDTIKNLGIIMVAAAGNESTNQQSYPAAYSGVLSVSAVTMEKKAAWYTNYGPWVDIAAPGGNSSADLNGDGYPDGVLSTSGDDSSGTVKYLYTFLQGTSMAAPHVAGVFALMKSVYPGLTFDVVTTLLEKDSLTDDTGDSGRDDYMGYGLVNAQKCLAAATDLAQGVQTPDPARLVASPEAINFGSSAQSQTLTIVNGGTGDLWMNPPVSSLFWLTIAKDKIDAANLGTYVVTANRSALTENTSYSGTITLTSTANTLEIPVTIYQPSLASANGDLGTHYIQMENTETDKISQVQGNAENGEYAFSFTNLPVGTYRLYAGNDPDNDGFILGSWEAVGGYKTVELPTLINVNDDISDLQFFTGYNFAISATALAVPSTTSRKEVIKEVAP